MRSLGIFLLLSLALLWSATALGANCQCESEYCKMGAGGISVGVMIGMRVFSYRDVKVGASIGFSFSLDRNIVFRHKCTCWDHCCPKTVDIRGEGTVDVEEIVVEKDHQVGRWIRQVRVMTALEGELTTTECRCPASAEACYVEQTLTSWQAGGSISVGASLTLGPITISGRVTIPHQPVFYECKGICRPDGCSNPAIRSHPIEPIWVPAMVSDGVNFNLGFRDYDLPHDSHVVTALAPYGMKVFVSQLREDAKDPKKRWFSVELIDQDAPQKGEIWVKVEDSCGKRTSLAIPYFLVYPPQIKPVGEPEIAYVCGVGLKDSGLLLEYEIVDPNDDPYGVLVKVEGVGGDAFIGFTGLQHILVYGTGTILVRFCPYPRQHDAKVVVRATHRKYNLVSIKNRSFVVNQPPN